MAFFFLTSVRGTILERLASLTASSYVHVIYSVSTDRSSVVTEIILDGRYSHLKKQQKITDQLNTKTNKQTTTEKHHHHHHHTDAILPARLELSTGWLEF